MRSFTDRFLFIALSLFITFTASVKGQQIQIEQAIVVEPEQIGEICTLDPTDINANYKFAPHQQTGNAKLNQANATSEFDITYVSSCGNRTWPEEAISAFDFAVDIWSTHLDSSIPIRIRADWTRFDNDRVLGSAGPTLFFTLTGDGIFSDTFYPIALASALEEEDLANEFNDLTGGFDIVVDINCNFDSWYFGTDANTPENQADMVTVLLHEVGHGVGFVGSMRANNSSQRAEYGFGNNLLPIVYDQFVLDTDFSNIVDPDAFANTSNELYRAVTGRNGGIFFNGLEAEFALDNQRVPLYAPNPYEPGASYSHLDQQPFTNSENALMRPFLDSQLAIHSPGPVFCGMLKDMGWPLGASCEDLLFDDAEIQRPLLSLPANGSKDQPVQPQLVWSDVDGADGYRVEISRDFNHTETVLSVPAAGTSLTVPDELDFGTLFFWRVRGETGETEGSWSNTFRFNTIIGIPDAVTLIAPENNAENLSLGLTLSWQPKAGAEQYRVQLSTDEDLSTLLADEIVENTFFPTGNLLSFFTNYYWRVRAENFAGEGEWSEIRTFKTIIERPEPVVLGEPFENENQVNVNTGFMWQQSDRASNYIIQVSTSEDFSQLPVQGNTESTMFNNDAPLEFATIYFWRVKATNIGGESDWSDVGRFITEVRETKIFPNFPNPFNASTNLKYQLSRQGRVTIELFDIAGRKVAVFVDEEKQPGVYFLRVDGSPYASGTYLARFVTGEIVDVQKIAIIK